MSRTSQSTVTSVNDLNTVVDILAANPRRQGVVIYNTSSAILYLKYGAAATTSSFTYAIAASGQWTMPADHQYVGLLTGIWASDQSGAAIITEITA